LSSLKVYSLKWILKSKKALEELISRFLIVKSQRKSLISNYVSRIESLNKKINFFLEQAEILGEEGKIDESENLLKEIEKMKLQRTELSTMSENPFLQMEKQMRVCEICGAMQSMSDTEKRLTTHLEGKLHTGISVL